MDFSALELEVRTLRKPAGATVTGELREVRVTENYPQC